MEKKYAVLVIDMLNEYLCPEGKVYCKEAIEIVPNIKKIIDFGHEKKLPIIYVNSSLISANEPLAKKWGLHAVRGSWGAKVFEVLQPSELDYIVEKRTYDGFYNSELEITLRSLDVTNVILTGIHTHVCVLITGVSAFNRGFDVVAIEDCITTGYKPNHESRLRFYKTHIGDIINLEQFINNFNS